MKLNEIANLKDTKLTHINSILWKWKLQKVSKINPDMSVDVERSLTVPMGWSTIPIRFNRVKGTFTCRGTHLRNLTNSPRFVEGDVDCTSSDLETLIGAPDYIGKDFDCFHLSRLKSLHGVETWIPNIKIGGSICVDQTHLLGLALIEGIDTVVYYSSATAKWSHFDISHHDPFQFQEQLLEHGLTEQAQL